MDGRGMFPVNFEEQDAGSGPVYNSPSLGPVISALHNINGRHLHNIGTAVPDDRQFLRTWRRQLQECLSSQNSRVIKFLLADISGEDDLSRRCLDVLHKYSRPTWNFASSISDLELSVDLSDSTAEITAGLGGMTPADLRKVQKNAIRLYVDTAVATSTAEAQLEEKLNKFQGITAKINDLMIMESTAELEGLSGPVRTYLDSILNKFDIESDYKNLIANYKKFAILKGLVSLQNLQRSAAPTCTICMTKEVSHVIAPCGHTFCEDCCRNQFTACYICRVQVRDRMRLYFS